MLSSSPCWHFLVSAVKPSSKASRFYLPLCTFYAVALDHFTKECIGKFLENSCHIFSTKYAFFPNLIHSKVHNIHRSLVVCKKNWNSTFGQHINGKYMCCLGSMQKFKCFQEQSNLGLM